MSGPDRTLPRVSESPVRVPVRVLYVDDSETDHVDFSLLFEEAWALEGTGRALAIECILDFNDARRRLRDDPRRYDLVIADLLRRRDGQDEPTPMGQHVIRNAREAGIPALALTESNEAEDHRRAKKHGALDVISKDEVQNNDHDQAKLRGYLRRALIDTDIVDPYIDVALEPSSAEDLAFDMLVEAIGRRTIIKLAMALFGKQPRPRSIRLSAIDSGRSGAILMGIRCLMAVPDAPERRPMVIKVSRDAYLLEQEVAPDRGRIVESKHRDLIVPPIRPETVSADGWHAIAYDRLDATTLTRWLDGHPSSAEVERVLGTLFDVRLGLWPSRTEIVPESDTGYRGPGGMLWTRFSARLRTRVRLALRDLRPLRDRFGPPDGSPSNWDLAGHFMRTGGFDDGGRFDPPGRVWTSPGHGDLHGRNIMITRVQPAPRLIDTATFARHHWACDLARLIVDIFLTNWHGHSHRSHMWDDISGWLAVGVALVAGEPVAGRAIESAAGEAVGAALDDLRARLETHPALEMGAEPYEFELALALECLRRGSSPSPTTPKRVLGLQLGAHTLMSLARRWRDGTLSGVRPAPETGSGA